MRALCGAIIAAGAMIGLGLITIGIGMRYSTYPYLDLDGDAQWVKLRHLDTALLVSLSAALIVLAIGLGIAFVGLAYHHQRRHLEWHHRSHSSGSPTERVTV